MKIGIDIMGGDYAPDATISGVIAANSILPSDVDIVLIGHKDIILSTFSKLGLENTFEIEHATEVISMSEKPTKALTQKPNSSIALGFKLVKEKKIDAFASAGNTGAMLVGSIYSFGAIQGVNRPCTMSFLPKEDGKIGILLDVGTNTDCKPETLKQFGIIGSIYAKNILNIENPKVGILSIGAEDEKGNIQSLAAASLMRQTPKLNFIGNVEGRYLFKDIADVIVTDGFTGNIVLKTCESMFRIFVKRGFTDEYINRFNYEIYGGTPILGIDATIIVGHGISNAIAIKNMLLLTYNVHKANLPEKIEKALGEFMNS